jgi:hypothetical protein
MAAQLLNLSLPLFCAFCQGAVELQYEREANPETVHVTLYECPYCHEENPLKIPGRVLWVTERDATKDIAAPPTRN